MIDNSTGLLFQYRNAADLRRKMEILFSNETLVKQYGQTAFEKINSMYSAEVHYKSLINLFDKLVAKK